MKLARFALYALFALAPSAESAVSPLKPGEKPAPGSTEAELWYGMDQAEKWNNWFHYAAGMVAGVGGAGGGAGAGGM